MQKFKLFHLIIGAISFALLGFVVEQVFPYDGTDRDEKRDMVMTIVNPLGTIGPDVAEFVKDLAVYAVDSDKRHEIATKPLRKKQKLITTKLERLKTSGNLTAYNTLMDSYREQLFTIAKTTDGIPMEVRVLLESNISIDINGQDTKDRTLLFYATSKKNAYLVRYLLSQGADPEIKDYVGLRPVDLLDKQKDRDLYLAFHHIDVDQESQKNGLSYVNVTYTYDQQNNITATKVIGEKKSTWSPLMLAIQDHSTLKALQYINNDQYIYDQTNNGSTALFLAIKYKDDEVLDALLQHGSNIQHRNRFKMNPLALAIKTNNLYAVQKLVDKGVDIKSICASERTPVKFAQVNQREEIEKYLISIGAS